jgi:hypothetical protein
VGNATVGSREIGGQCLRLVRLVAMSWLDLVKLVINATVGSCEIGWAMPRLDLVILMALDLVRLVAMPTIGFVKLGGNARAMPIHGCSLPVWPDRDLDGTLFLRII